MEIIFDITMFQYFTETDGMIDAVMIVVIGGIGILVVTITTVFIVCGTRGLENRIELCWILLYLKQLMYLHFRDQLCKQK